MFTRRGYICCYLFFMLIVAVTRLWWVVARCSGTLAKRARCQARHDAQRCSLFLFICFVNCSSTTSSFILLFQLISFALSKGGMMWYPAQYNVLSCFLPSLYLCCWRVLQLPVLNYYSCCGDQWYSRCVLQDSLSSIDRLIDDSFVWLSCNLLIVFILHPYQ